MVTVTLIVGKSTVALHLFQRFMHNITLLSFPVLIAVLRFFNTRKHNKFYAENDTNSRKISDKTL